MKSSFATFFLNNTTWNQSKLFYFISRINVNLILLYKGVKLNRLAMNAFSRATTLFCKSHLFKYKNLLKFQPTDKIPKNISTVTEFFTLRGNLAKARTKLTQTPKQFKPVGIITRTILCGTVAVSVLTKSCICKQLRTVVVCFSFDWKTHSNEN